MAKSKRSRPIKFKVNNSKTLTTSTGTWTNIGTATHSSIRFLNPDERQCIAHGGGAGELGCTECEEVHRYNQKHDLSHQITKLSTAAAGTANAFNNFNYTYTMSFTIQDPKSMAVLSGITGV